MTNIFISYSRRNKEFTQQLVNALLAANREVWADWQNIPAASDWDAEIKEGIRQAESVLFVLSSEWLKSNECRKELDYALLMGKRLITILHQPIEYNELPAELKKVNWIDMSDPTNFDRGFQTVCTALDTDLGWIKTHTRIQVRAVEWDKKNRDNSFTLRGKDLTDGEQFIAGSANKNPAPTPLQSDYILASRKDATRRSRITLGGVTVALVVSIVLGILAWLQRQAAVAAEATAEIERDHAVVAQNTAVAAEATAVANEQEAKRQAAISRSGQLAAQANEIRDRDYQLSLLLGVEGYRLVNTRQTRTSLMDATNTSPVLGYLTLPKGNGRTVFSPDGRTVATISADSSIVIWDLATNRPKHAALFVHKHGIYALAFNNDGTILASVGCADPGIDEFSGDNCPSGEAIFWDMGTYQPIGQPITGFTAAAQIVHLSFSSDGETLVVSNWDAINLIDVATGTLRDQWMPGALNTAASSKGNMLGVGDLEISILDIETGQLMKRLSREDGARTDQVLFSPDGKTIVSRSFFLGINLIDLATGKARRLNEGVGDYYMLDCVALSPDGKILVTSRGTAFDASGGNTEIVFWDTETMEPIARRSAAIWTHSVRNLAFNQDGTILYLGLGNNSILVWDVKLALHSEPDLYRPLGKVLYQPATTGEQLPEKSVVYSPNGKLLAANNQESINFWDASTYQKLELSIPGNGFTFNNDGSLLAVYRESELSIWDMTQKQQIAAIPTDSYVYQVAFMPGTTKFLTIDSSTSSILLWDFSDVTEGQLTPQPYFTVNEDTSIDQWALSPDGKHLAVKQFTSQSADETSKMSVVLWDTGAHTQAPLPLENETQAISKLAFSSDSTILRIMYDGGTSTSWDVATRKQIGAPTDLNGPMSSDGTTVGLVGSQNNRPDTITLWDITSGQRLGNSFSGHHGLIQSVTFSPDGKVLASVDSDGTVILWNLDPEFWADLACKRVGRNFTRQEWALYFPNEEYRKTCNQWPLEGDKVGILNQPAIDLSLPTPQPDVTEAPAAIETPAIGDTAAAPDASVVTEPPATTSETTFLEEFDGSMDSWSTFMTSGIARQVKTSLDGGNLNIQLVISDGKLPWAYWINDSSTYSNVQVEAVVTNNGNNSNGVSLVCQHSDAGWYEFTVSNAGLYEIYAYDPNRLPEERYQQLIAGGSPAIQVGHSTNTYTAVCNGSELGLSINGTLVNTFTDTRYNYTEGKIGFGASSPNRIPIDVTFESLSVSVPE